MVKASYQRHPLKAAVEIAKGGDITTHELRHSYASRLVMAGRGTPLFLSAIRPGTTPLPDRACSSSGRAKQLAAVWSSQCAGD